MIQSKKYFCYEIYKNLSIWSKNGKLNYGPCSFYSEYIKSTDNFELDKVWNSAEHNRLKQLINENKPIPGCSACYKAELAGLESRRQGAAKLFENFFNDNNINLSGPQSIDYSVGNLCNLKCTTCGPENSTAWIPDYQQIYPTFNIEPLKYQKNNQIEVTDPALLKNIINVHFHGGGEPLLVDNHINLLKEIKQVKGLADVHVFYNTNGTIKPSAELLDLWNECRLVELYFSIDAVGERFNYLRYGADWQEVQNNLQWYRQHMPVNHMFKVNCTWGYLNVYYLTEVVDWHKEHFQTNRLGDPTNLIFQPTHAGNFLDFSLKTISLDLLNLLKVRFANYPELLELLHMLRPTESVDHGKFWSDIEKVDQVRSTSYKETFPEWAGLISF